MVGGQLDFRVLGPVEATRDGTPLSLGGRRQRALLALLLLDVGRPVATDRLVDELFGSKLPPGSSTLPSYVSRLRAALGGGVAIESGASGYTLHASPQQIDARRFEQLVEEGRRLHGRGRFRRARDRLREALALWRGRPFGDLTGVGALSGMADRLFELRLLALESRLDADLALGASAEIIDELEALVGEHSYRERFWGQLMLALYRADRQADALAAFHRARRALSEELGLEPSNALHEIQQQILRHDPVPKPQTARHNLPASGTSFIGREAELAEVERLLEDARLVTLTGVGGVGKTRLALEAAARVAPDIRDGCRFVDLASIADPNLVAQAVALTLGLGDLPDQAAADAIAEVLGDAELLLLLDNCEHVRDAAAGLAQRLLTASPGLVVMATSREVLGVPGEVDVPVPPLSLVSRGAEASASDAVRLFFERARAARRGMPEDEVAVAAAARICADLDGLPLAIELAAARVTALSLDEIANRLADRFRFLVSWRRLSPARHRTLREAMDWSFELLSPDERLLLAAMSVFAGHFTLDAVARVCTDADEERALAGIERLIAASLVLTEEQDGTMRYRLLETVRQYAGEQLAGDAAIQVRRAHAHYYLRLAERADLTAVSRGAGQRLEIAIRAQDNLRGALAWAIESGSVAFGLELATSLERFWAIHDAREGMGWFASLFARPEASDVAPAVRANALRAYGGAADIAGEDDTARRLWEESLAVFRELDDEPGQAVLLHRLAISAQRRGDLVGARELVDASHLIHERSGNRWGQAQTLGTLGAIARDDGDERRAFELLGASLELAREARVTWWVSGTLAELANLDLNAGRIQEAAGRARESLELADRMADRAGQAFGVGLLARVAFESAHHELARRLWIAVEGEDAGAPLGGWRHHRESYRRRLAGLLPASEHGTAGERPTLEEAVSLALAGAPSDEPARPAAQT